VQPGIRISMGDLDIGCYLTIPVDRPLGGGNAFALASTRSGCGDAGCAN
jgi:hypothetical protein